MGTTTKKVAARFKERMASASGDRLMRPLSDAIDDLVEAKKKAEKALQALRRHTESVVKSEDFQARVKGLDREAPQQMIGYMREHLETAKKGIESLASEYDDAAIRLKRMGI